MRFARHVARQVGSASARIGASASASGAKAASISAPTSLTVVVITAPCSAPNPGSRSQLPDARFHHCKQRRAHARIATNAHFSGEAARPARSRASTSPPDAGASRIPASGRHDDPAKQKSPRRRLSVLPRTRTSVRSRVPLAADLLANAITRAAPTRRSPLVRCGHVVATRRLVAFLRASSAPAAPASCRARI